MAGIPYEEMAILSAKLFEAIGFIIGRYVPEEDRTAALAEMERRIDEIAADLHPFSGDSGEAQDRGG